LLVPQRLVKHVKCLMLFLEPLLKLALVDDKRRSDVDDGGAEQSDESNLVERLCVSCGCLGSASVEVVGLLAVGLDDVEGSEEAGGAVLLDRGVGLR